MYLRIAPLLAVLGLAIAVSAAPIDNKNQSSITSGASLPANKDKPKVLVIIGDATELLDTMYPVYRLQEAGFQPVFATPEVRTFQTVLHEVKPGWTITKEWEGYTIISDIAFKDVKPEEYVGIFFSGGRAPEYLREDEALLAATRYYWEKGLPMMSVCHGVEIVARAGIVKGLHMATVPKCKFDLEVCGGIFVNAPVVIDRNMVSGRTFHDHGAFVGPWIKMLEANRDKK